ncbi:hypothetical protein FRC09_015328 [Ceratobasidium sp. 395]|nr:hypothetical protein FRC09_015328 [Ceratobasidium sp. 395]
MVSITLASLAAIASFFAQTVLAAPSPTVDANGDLVKRAASCTFPSPPKTSSLSAAMTITGTFDGENVVIGANQAEGIHCLGPCNIYNVWFEDVCEDAISIKQSSGTSNIKGGGAKNADDKVIQHNGGARRLGASGTVNIDSYCVQNFGKLYRSCGNCSTQYKRTVNISNVIASSGKVLAGVNSNYGDVATIQTSTNKYTSVKSICDTFEGNNSGKEPKTLTTNTPNANCKF